MAVRFNSALDGTVVLVIMINKVIRENIKRGLKRLFGGQYITLELSEAKHLQVCSHSR